MSEENKNIEPCGNEENKESLESQEIIDSPEELTESQNECEIEPEYEPEYEEKLPKKKPNVSLGTFVLSLIATAVVTAMLTMTLLGNYVKGAVGESLKDVRPGQTQDTQNNNNNNSSLNGQQLTEIDIIDLLMSAYFYGDVDKDKLTAASLRAYLEATGDLYATYYTQEEIDEANNEDAGRMYGIGVNIINSVFTFADVEYKVLKITNVMKNSPALEAGLKAGDMVVYVGIGDDKQTVTGLGYDEALRLLKGLENTKAEFVVWRVLNDGTVKELEYSVERREVITDSVYSHVSTVDPKVGIVKISSFELQTPVQFEEAIDELIAAGCEKFVLDVRYNPGGYEISVAAILSYFLEEGDVYIRTEDKYGNKQESKVAVVSGHTGDYAACNVSKEDIGKYKDLDMVVLCNENTASAGELFTATFKDYGLGEVIGTTTYGKGKMQTTFMLEQFGLEGAIKFTTHMYMSAKSEGYDGIGVSPDIVIERSEEAMDYNIYDIPDDKDNQLLKAIEQLNK